CCADPGPDCAGRKLAGRAVQAGQPSPGAGGYCRIVVATLRNPVFALCHAVACTADTSDVVWRALDRGETAAKPSGDRRAVRQRAVEHRLHKRYLLAGESRRSAT